MASKFVPKVLGATVIFFVLANTIFDFYSIFRDSPPDQQLQRHLEQKNDLSQNHHLGPGDQVNGNKRVQVDFSGEEKENSVDFSDADYLILTSAHITSAKKLESDSSSSDNNNINSNNKFRTIPQPILYKTKNPSLSSKTHFVNDTIFDVNLHKMFWNQYNKNVKRNSNNTTNHSDNNDLDIMKKKEDENFLENYFKHKSLWPPIIEDNRNSTISRSQKHKQSKKVMTRNGTNTKNNDGESNNNSDTITFGFGPDYDGRVMAQYLWSIKAKQIKPNIFKGNKTKTIVIADSTAWWNYNGGQNLSCPGQAFDGRCEILERRSGFVDAYIFVRDAYHTRRHYPNQETASIYYILESPHFSPVVGLFRPNDYLASYWRGSDLQTSYGKWAYYNPTVRKIKQTKNYALGKTKMAAIFVSNCGAANKRLHYVNDLSQYVSVDVYGECGDLPCSLHEQNSCFDKLKKQYRFYLAFENSNCRDYITEKFFVNALKNDVVPIVMGAHPDDYRAAAPEGSFIHVEDFESPKFLAAYMKFLAKNPDNYNKYFEWKGTGEFVSMDFFCRVCALLFYADEYPRQERDPKSKKKYIWSPHSDLNNPMCLEWGEWYWEPRQNSTIQSSSSPDFTSMFFT